MSPYAILDAPQKTVMDVREYDDQWYAQAVAAGNPKVGYVRPLVTDAAPAITAAQKLQTGPYAIEAARVRRTWIIVAKAASEVEQDARLAQLTALATAIATFEAGTATNAQAQRAIAFLLRQVQLQGVR